MKRRILIVAEAVTLAHVARPLALAKILEGLGHEVVVACSPSARRWFDAEGRGFEPIESISQERFLKSLYMGKPLYNTAMLRRYVEADVALMDRVCPDVVIGDFRLSLHVSTKLCKLPYGAVTNAYWSPKYFQYAQVPDIPLTRAVGIKVADILFRVAYRPAFAWHARAYSETARYFGVAPASGGLLGAYTASDCTAYADVAEFYNATNDDSSHELFLGPLLWSPKNQLPKGAERWGTSRPLIYVTLGSSGSPHVAAKVLAALADLSVDVFIATAEATIDHLPANAMALDYAPGDVLCQRATLVIGNGGSPITYQALAAGKPVLGLASNFDQFLNMHRVEALGAGRCLRAADALDGDIRAATVELTNEPAFRIAAERARLAIAASDVPAPVKNWLRQLVA